VSGAVLAFVPGALRICGSSTGPITVVGATRFVLIGDPQHGCAPNKVTGSIVAFGNTAGLAVIGNTLTGSVFAFLNSGAGPPGQISPIVSGNTP
jgi:hypothetical protein